MRGVYLKIMLCLLLLLSLLISPCSAIGVETDDNSQRQYMPDGLAQSAQSAVLLERDSLRVLYEKNARERLPMASTTKVMTALVAIEKGNLDDIVTVSGRAFGMEGSSIYLGKGERARLGDLLYGLMLQSGNDAAVAIAEHVGGSVEGFAEMMNDKAREIGAVDTHFVNPHGLQADDHYTTAYDLALISAHAMRNPVFREIVGTRQKRIPWGDRSYNRVLKNKNKLLARFPDATGIKTGFTKAAGRCLAFSAEREGMEVVGAVINCGDYFNDAAELMDAAFEVYAMSTAFEPGEVVRVLPVRNGEYDTVAITVQNDLKGPAMRSEEFYIEINLDKNELKAPIKAGEKVGCAVLYAGGEVIGSQPLVAAIDTGKAGFFKSLSRTWSKWPIFSMWSM